MSFFRSNFFPAPVLVGIVLIFFISFCIVYSCNRSDDEEEAASGYGQMPGGHEFAGGQTCQSCHEEEWEAWKGSHHDYAIAEADEESVRGDFDNAAFTEGDDVYRFFREGDKYMVEAPGPDGEQATYEITYTFGWEPLQQYLVDFGKGKLQALQLAWDTERNRWFSLRPDEQIEHDDWMHWTGGAMNWNTMCADCHSTKLRQNYIAEEDSFHTTWSDLNVNCEACHGPGGDHVALMNSEESEEASTERIRSDLELTRYPSQMEEINTCAPCHSLRQKLTDEYIHGSPFMDHYEPMLPHPENYFADGQIREEVYVYASFLQSKMYIHGVQCTDCHDPHTLELKANIHDNSLCMQCHEPVYNTPEHHFHQMNTEASQCVNCHMTGRYYMEVDYRRDHSFRIPRPDQSEQFGTPNACNDCHTDQSAEWAAQAIDEWYGEERSPHFSDVMLKADEEGQGVSSELRELIADTSQPDIMRATAVWYVGEFPDMQSAEILEQAMQSDSPIIRNSAVKAMENLPPDQRPSLLTEALQDSVRSVRLSAVRNLAGSQEDDFDPPLQDPFRESLQEYREYLELNRYFPQGQMNRGQYFEQRGEIEQAMEAYRDALEKDPYFNPARVNLAYLHNSRGENDQAEELLREVTEQEPEYGEAYYSLGLLLAEEGRLQESIELFEQASTLMPEYGRVFYNLAIANQTLERPQEAEAAYLHAIELEPRNGDYRYGLITLYMQQEQYEQALEHAEVLDSQNPGNPRIQQLINTLNQRL